VRADAHAPGALVIQYANPSDAGLISALDPIAAALTADWLEHIADESGAFYRTLDGHPALALAQYILGEDQ
jgi:hypothetical protein